MTLDKHQYSDINSTLVQSQFRFGQFNSTLIQHWFNVNFPTLEIRHRPYNQHWFYVSVD